jgi:aconitate decarboxylase
VNAPRGVDPALINKEILERWRNMAEGVVDNERRLQIEAICMSLDCLEDIMELGKLLAGITKNPIL